MYTTCITYSKPYTCRDVGRISPSVNIFSVLANQTLLCLRICYSFSSDILFTICKEYASFSRVGKERQ